MKKSGKMLAILLTLAMLFSMSSTMAFAADANELVEPATTPTPHYFSVRAATYGELEVPTSATQMETINISGKNWIIYKTETDATEIKVTAKPKSLCFVNRYLISGEEVLIDYTVSENIRFENIDFYLNVQNLSTGKSEPTEVDVYYRPTVQVEKIGNGEGTAAVKPEATDSDGYYTNNTSLTLTASASLGSYFDGWYDAAGNFIQAENALSHKMVGPVLFKAKFTQLVDPDANYIEFKKVIRVYRDGEWINETPKAGQFTFTLSNAKMPKDPGLERADTTTPIYSVQAKNDEFGNVRFGYDVNSKSALISGSYMLREEQTDGYESFELFWGMQLMLKTSSGDNEVKLDPSYLSSNDPSEALVLENYQPVLIEKTADKTVVKEGETVQYTVKLTSQINGTLHLYLTDILGTETKLDQAVELEYGVPQEFTYSVVFPTAGTFINTASVTIDNQRIASPGFINPLDAKLAIPEFYATSSVTVTVEKNTSPVFVDNTPKVALTIDVEGPGAATPGTGAYSQNSVVQFTVTPEAGAEFIGWFGPNGTEIVDNRITMNEAKSVTARFAVPVIEDNKQPESAPAPTPAPKDTGTDEVVIDQAVPNAAPSLPKTAGLPMEILLAAGAALVTLGSVKRRK